MNNQNQNRNKKQKVAIYYRVSTEGQSLKVQQVDLPKYAKKMGWEIYKEYQDEGISGATIEKRPGFTELLQDIKEQKFGRLLVVEFSRVTRSDKIAEWGMILDLLKEKSVILNSQGGREMDLNMEGQDLFGIFEAYFATKE